MKPLFNKAKRQSNNKNKNTQNSSFDNSNTNVSNPITAQQEQNMENNQIIRGYFINEKSYKELIVQRVNSGLCCILGFLVLFCFICYYFVSCKEVQLNQISRQTLELNYENEELQNKVDSLQSYYNIDKAVSKTNILERAKQVVEVDAIDIPKIDLKKQNKNKHRMVVNY